MSKILALDLGDQWIGIAISDAAGFIARPYKTVEIHELDAFLRDCINQEKLTTIVLGLPTTMRHTISQQTQKILTEKERLATVFPAINWILWDERLSSKRAQELKYAKTKEEKRKSHAVAAAFILDSYLVYRSQTTSVE